MYIVFLESRAPVNVTFASCSILIIEFQSGTRSVTSANSVRSCEHIRPRRSACIAESVIKAWNSVSERDDDDDDDGGGGSDDDEKATEKLFDAVTPRLALTPEL